MEVVTLTAAVLVKTQSAIHRKKKLGVPAGINAPPSTRLLCQALAPPWTYRSRRRHAAVTTTEDLSIVVATICTRTTLAPIRISNLVCNVPIPCTMIGAPHLYMARAKTQARKTTSCYHGIKGMYQPLCHKKTKTSRPPTNTAKSKLNTKIVEVSKQGKIQRALAFPIKSIMSIKWKFSINR